MSISSNHKTKKQSRVTENSSTIIDRTITNEREHKVRPSISLRDFTDHHPIVCLIEKDATLMPRLHFTVLTTRNET